MKTLQKLLPVLLALTGLFAAHWIFNHVNVWLGIAAYVITTSLCVDYLVKLFKNSSNENTHSKDDQNGWGGC